MILQRFLNRGCEFMCLDYHLCHYFPFILFVNIGVSLYIMVLIALQRFFGVFYSHINFFNRTNMIWMIIVVWIFSFASLSFPLTKTWGQFGYEPQTFSCTIVLSEGETFFPIMAFGGVGLPCLFIMLSYGAIYWKVKSTGKQFGGI